MTYYRSRDTYVLMFQASTLVTMPSINEKLASRMTTPYRILLPVKCQILRHAVVQFGIEFVYLYICLDPRYNCVTREASTVPVEVNLYVHIFTSRAVRTTSKKGSDQLPERAAGLS